MDNHQNFPSGFPNNGYQAPYNNPFGRTPRLANNEPLPGSWQHAIAAVTMDDLVNLNFNLAPRLDADIDSIFWLDGHQLQVMHWYRTVYQGSHRANPIHRRQHLRIPLSNIPYGVMVTLNSATDDNEWQRWYERWCAQQFLRHLLRALGTHDRRVAQTFIDTLRASSTQPTPPAPFPALVPVPITITTSAATPAPATFPATTSAPMALPTVSQPPPTTPSPPAPATSPEDNEKKRLYCPLCETSRKSSDFRGLKHHWRTQHYRSNRATMILEQKRKGGKLGPWTAEEAEQMILNGSRHQETKQEREQRRTKSRNAKKWIRGMSSNPEETEKEAQVEDGYSDYDDSYVTHLMKNRAEGRKKKGEAAKVRSRTGNNTGGEDNDHDDAEDWSKEDQK